MEAFLISLPVFLIIFIGWLLKKYKIVTEQWINILNEFAYYVSLPALIIINLWNINFLEKTSWNIVLYSLTSIILFSALIFVILLFVNIKHSKKAAIFLTATTGNTIYMGIPLIMLGFGNKNQADSALISIIYLTIPILITIFIIKYWHNKNHKIMPQLQAFVKNPLVFSAIIGFFISFLKTDLAVIDMFKKFISMFAVTASPIALFTLGAFFYGKSLTKDITSVSLVSIIKTIFFPLLITIWIINFTNINHPELFILLASMPVAVTTFVIAKKFKIEENLVTNSILVSTILSFFIATLIIYLF